MPKNEHVLLVNFIQDMFYYNKKIVLRKSLEEFKKHERMHKHIKMITECGGRGKGNNQSKSILNQRDLRKIYSQGKNMDFIEQKQHN